MNEPMFPDSTEWWKSPGKGESGSNNSNSNNNCNGNNNNRRVDARSNGHGSYGSLPFPSREPVLIDINALVPEFSEFVVNGKQDKRSGWGEVGPRPLDVPSDISNQSSSSHDDSGSDGGGGGSFDDEDDIEPPHRTLGLLAFDFLRFVTVSANARCVTTQMFPVFLSRGRMEVLHVALRIFITLFSLLLICFEFPDLCPFLQHAPRSPNSPPPPSLSLINWIPRGIFYAFLSVVCFYQALVIRALDEDHHASTSSRFFDSIFIVMTAWFMLVVGALYVLLGLCCVQRIMERIRRDERDKWEEYHEKVHAMELEMEEAEEQEWLSLNNVTKEVPDASTIRGAGRSYWQKGQRWKRRCVRRRSRGRVGFWYQFGCRRVDWRC